MKNLNYNNPIEIAKGIYWIGYRIEKAIFQSNPYLIVDKSLVKDIAKNYWILFELLKTD